MMEKKINRLLRRLQLEFVLMWAIVVAEVVLFEADFLPQGTLTANAKADYFMRLSGILLALALIPLSLRLFNLSLTRYVRQLPLPGALVSYRRWSEVRLSLLLAPAVFNLTSYYCTLNTTGLLCTGMVMIASLFCVPGRQRLLSELDLINPADEAEV